MEDRTKGRRIANGRDASPGEHICVDFNHRLQLEGAANIDRVNGADTEARSEAPRCGLMRLKVRELQCMARLPHYRASLLAIGSKADERRNYRHAQKTFRIELFRRSKRFRDCVGESSADKVAVYPSPPRGPGDEELSTDVAWFGDKRAPKVDRRLTQEGCELNPKLVHFTAPLPSNQGYDHRAESLLGA